MILQDFGGKVFHVSGLPPLSFKVFIKHDKPFNLCLWQQCVSSSDLVVSEGHAAANALLHADITKVTAPLATGLRDRLTGAEEPEEAFLEVLGATHATAVELYGETQRGRTAGID